MKILLITVRSDFGGGPRHVDQLVKNLPPDVDIYMAYPEVGDPYAELWKTDKRIKGIFYIPYRKFSIRALLGLIRFVEDNKIGIVHSHGNGAGLYSRMLKMLCHNVKVVHTYHGISDVYRSKVKFMATKIVGLLLSPFADLYICVSNGEKRMAIDRNFSRNNNTVVIYNGIPTPLESNIRDTFHYPLKIVTLSRFDYQKNMDCMFQIAKHWAGSNAVRFVWVGDGEDKARLEQLAKEENVPIDFIGFTTEPIKYLISSDLYLSTSRFEGLPYGLIEAASVGLPIVASNVKGNNEVVSYGKNGFLFKEESEAITYIESIMSDKACYRTMSAASIDFFNNNFTEEKMLNALMDEYEKLFNKC